YPTSVSWPFRIPLFWIAFHVLPLSLYKLLAYSALRKDGHLNLYFHPWEFSNQLAERKWGVPQYISACSSDKLLQKMDKLIDTLKTKGCIFQTTQKYLGLDG